MITCLMVVTAVLSLPGRWPLLSALAAALLTVLCWLVWGVRLLGRRWWAPRDTVVSEQGTRRVVLAMSLTAAVAWLLVGTGFEALSRVYLAHPEYRVYHEDGLTAGGIRIRIVLAAGAFVCFGLVWGVWALGRRGARWLGLPSHP